jgi:hypothetical protein
VRYLGAAMGAFKESVTKRREADALASRCLAVSVSDHLDDEEDRELYLSLLAEPVAVVGHTWLRNTLVDAGAPRITTKVIERHRAEQCCCYGVTYSERDR